jgi:hypothetical protein
VQSVVQEAMQIVAKRGKDYGHPLPNHKRIAAIWTVVFADKLKPGEVIEPHEVVLAMMGTKLARLIETPNHRDSMVDQCGYADCMDIITKVTHATGAENNRNGQAVAAGVSGPTTIDGNGEVSRHQSSR